MMVFLQKRWQDARKLTRLSVVRGAASIFVAQFLRIFVQLFYFVLLTRTLGVNEYGLFVGTMAFVKLFYPFSSWGWPQILVKNVSRDRRVLPVYWGNALLVSAVFGGFLTVLLTFLASSLFSGLGSTRIVFLIAIAELIFARFYDVSLKVFAALDQFKLNAVNQFLLSVGNFLAVASFAFLLDIHSALVWSALYLCSRILTAAISFGLIVRSVSCWPKLQLNLIPASLKEGLYFSIGLSSSTVYNDADKTMLSQLSTLQATGIYGASYRAIDVAMTPIMSVLAAVSSRFFRKGEQGIAASLAFTKRLLPFVTAYGLGASLMLCFFAGFVANIFGDDYAESAEALRWLSFIVIFRVWQYFAADALTGAEYQGVRSLLQIAIALFNVGLNFWLIPRYSWRGAAWSSLISDALLALSLWLVIRWVYHKQLKAQAHQNESQNRLDPLD